MLEHDASWSVDRTASSVGSTFTPIQLPFGAVESVLYLTASTLATTQSFTFATAIDSSGPFVAEASTSIAANGTSGSIARLRVTGPYPWMRPQLNTASTGTYVFRLVAVR